MDIKQQNLEYILPTEKDISFMANLFQQGEALDLLNFDEDKSAIQISDEEQYVHVAAERAFERVDLDKLYKNADKFQLKEKYPKFFKFLDDRFKDIEEENAHDERLPDEAGVEEKAEEAEEEIVDAIKNEYSTAKTVGKNVVEGYHTGDQRDSEKWVEGDAERQKLTDAQNELLKELDEKKRAEGAQIKGSIHNGKENAGDVTHVVGGTSKNTSNKFQGDSYAQAGQKTAQKRGAKAASGAGAAASALSSFSYSSQTMAESAVNESDFVKTNSGNSYTTINIGKNFSAFNNINKVVRQGGVTKQLDKQGRAMHAVLGKSSMQEMRDIELSNDDIGVLTKNYDKILASNCASPKKVAQMNALLESRHLSAGERESLATSRRKLKEAGLTADVSKLQQQIKDGKLSGDKLKAATSYMNQYESSREKIIRNGVFKPSQRTRAKTRLEDGFFAASMGVLAKENGLPTDAKALKRALKKNTLTEAQKKVAKNILKMKRAMKLKEMAQKGITGAVKSVKGGVKKVKSLASKYMGDDYTMRGLLMFTSVAGKAAAAPKAAFKTVKRTRKIAKNTRKVFQSGARAAKAAARASRMAAKAAQKTAKVAAKTTKTATKTTIKATKPVAKGVLKVAQKAVTAAAKTIAKVVIKILTTIASAFIAIFGPIIAIIVAVMILIFTVFSFILKDGSDTYYDAGDYDTTETVQEMVDLLTLCHESFKETLQEKFGGSSSSSYGTVSSADGITVESRGQVQDEDASGVDTFESAAPQLQKGDTSEVAGKYNTDSSHWWNYEYSWSYLLEHPYSSGSRQGQLLAKMTSGELAVTESGGYAFIYNKVYMAATTLYWGDVGDILEVKFDKAFEMPGTGEETDTMYVVITDIKAYEHTHYTAAYGYESAGLYGHHIGGSGYAEHFPCDMNSTKRDFLEFTVGSGMSSDATSMNNLGVTPIQATNLGSVLDGTADLDAIGVNTGGSGINADIFYRQEIDQSTYRDIVDTKKNIYYTFPDEVEVKDMPDGISPTPTPKGYDASSEKGTVYGFYNNNQELISMVLAICDFDINNTSNYRKEIIIKNDSEDNDSNIASELQSKMSDDAWKLVTLFSEYGLNLTNYQEGSYDDIRYELLVGLFNATHIVTHTKVYEYHEGPDGTAGISGSTDGHGNAGGDKYDASQNTDGLAYQVPVMIEQEIYDYMEDGTAYVVGTYTTYKTDADGDIVYETKYVPCPGHKSNSVAIITLHFDSLLDIKGWWEDNIYDVDDFDEMNPDYESDNKDDENYKAKSRILKSGIQIINKPDYYKSTDGTCSRNTSSYSSLSYGPGETGSVNAQKLLNILNKYSQQVQQDYKNGVPWGYSNKASIRNGKTFEESEASTRDKKKNANCAHIAILALREMGLMPTNQKFYGLGGTKDGFKWSPAATKQTVLQFADILTVEVKGKTPNQLLAESNLKAGDIIAWDIGNGNHHTNIYAGNGLFFDAGRGGGKMSPAPDNYNANSVNGNTGKFVTWGPLQAMNMSSSRVLAIIRLR